MCKTLHTRALFVSPVKAVQMSDGTERDHLPSATDTVQERHFVFVTQSTV
jgi:hypothetical protein